MSRRGKKPGQKSDDEARARPRRRPLPALPEVVLARRPPSTNAPAEPGPSANAPHAAEHAVEPVAAAPIKRAARIVTSHTAVDEAERERQALLSRLLDSEGPSAITRAANAYRKGGFAFPEEQPVQLKLLEHTDEGEVCTALAVLTSLLDHQSPIKLPVFEQRLKRLEEGAEEAETRARAAELRRVLRT